MTRADFQALAGVRAAECEELLRAGRHEGAYYMAGYAVECALKAAIAKQTQQHDFPDKERAAKSHTHSLSELVRLAGLDGELQDEAVRNPAFALHWSVAKDWSEASRYHRPTRQDAESMVKAVTDDAAGVFAWVRRSW